MNILSANLPRPFPRLLQLRAKFLTPFLFIAWILMAGQSVHAQGQALPEQPTVSKEERPANDQPTASKAQKTRVFHFELAQDIMPPAWRTVQQAMNEARELNADVIIMSLDTYGGMVNLADSISQRLLHAKARTLVYIVNNAASAGALISISCDSIYMAPSAQIGAATVVNGTDGEAMPDKYQAYMRAKMRSLAEAKGRNPEIAEAMVDQDLEIPGLIEAGKTLVFTSSEAIENGYCEGIADQWQDCLAMAGIDDYELFQYEPTAIDKMVQFLVNPIFSGILLMVIFVGIYAELQSPGVGFPLLAASIAATLYFAPHYLDGLAAHWEIALFILGVILLAVEIFAIPGFGVTGILGLTFIVSSLVLSMVANTNFNFEWTATKDIVRSVLVVVLSLLVSIGFIITILGSLSDSPFLKRLVLAESQQKDQGFTVDSYAGSKNLTGLRGLAASELRPSGKIDLGNERYDAMTEGDFISKGSPVEVMAMRGNYLLVRKVSV